MKFDVTLFLNIPLLRLSAAIVFVVPPLPPGLLAQPPDLVPMLQSIRFRIWYVVVSRNVKKEWTYTRLLRESLITKR